MTDQLYVAIATYPHRRDQQAVVAIADTAELCEVELSKEVALQHNPGAWVQSLPTLIPVHRAPKPEPAWRQCTDEEQEMLAIAQIEEIRECAKDIAHEMLDELDAEGVQEFLKVLRDDDDSDDA